MQIVTDFKSYNFTFADIGPDENEVLQFLQATDSVEDHPVRLSVCEILSLLQSHNKISGGYIIKHPETICVKEGIINIENKQLNAGSQICGYLKESSHIALFVCTGGDIFTETASDYNKKGEYLEAFIVDAIGSLTVEKAMDRIQEYLAAVFIDKDLKISNRYSPGYCNWVLSEQKVLFELIGENPTGISLNSSCLMQPVKSVSGIIGIGKNIKKKAYGCEICRNSECIYRKILNKQQ